jgi:predicted Mrr-cat superfamily restriction endonuclease
METVLLLKGNIDRKTSHQLKYATYGLIVSNVSDLHDNGAAAKIANSYFITWRHHIITQKLLQALFI